MPSGRRQCSMPFEESWKNRALHTIQYVPASDSLTTLHLEIRASWMQIRSEIGRRLPVLLYHHVGPARFGTVPELTVSPDKFDRQMRLLGRCGYVGIRPSD